MHDLQRGRRTDRQRLTYAVRVSVEPCGAAITRSTSEAVFTYTLTRIVTVIHLPPHLITAARYNNNNRSSKSSSSYILCITSVKSTALHTLFPDGVFYISFP